MPDPQPGIPLGISPRSLPDQIRYFVSQLMKRAAAPGPGGDPDLELGDLAIALDTVADNAARHLAALELERDLAVAHDRQPYPTAWAYEQVCAARTAHQERADKAEAAVARVRKLLDDPCGLFIDIEIRAALDGSAS